MRSQYQSSAINNYLNAAIRRHYFYAVVILAVILVKHVLPDNDQQNVLDRLLTQVVDTDFKFCSRTWCYLHGVVKYHGLSRRYDGSHHKWDLLWADILATGYIQCCATHHQLKADGKEGSRSILARTNIITITNAKKVRQQIKSNANLHKTANGVFIT